MEDKLKTRRLENATITAQIQDEAELKFMRGKALINVARREMTFVENPPRLNRSVEVGRTMHARFVRRPDKNYTVTFRVSGEEKYLSEGLVAEIREIAKVIRADAASVKAAEAARARKEAENAED